MENAGFLNEKLQTTRSSTIMTSIDDNLRPIECKLLSGTFAQCLQVILGLIAISVLVLKRYQEVPQRPLMIWAFDASKQLIGAGFAHVANLLIALLLYRYEQQHASSHQVDQCAFYFVNFTMDTTFGVLLNWLLLSAFTQVAIHYHWTAVQTPGDYGSPIQVVIWLKQLVAWICIIFFTKILIAFVIIALSEPLSACAAWLFRPLQPYPHIELAIVMIACPCLMNAVQFWIQDSFLKKQETKANALPDHSPDGKEQDSDELKATKTKLKATAAAMIQKTKSIMTPKYQSKEKTDESVELKSHA